MRCIIYKVRYKICFIFLIAIFSLVFIFFYLKNILVTKETNKLNIKLTSFEIAEERELTIKNVFDSKSKKKKSREDIIMVVTGDIIPARSVNAKNTRLNNFLWPYLKIAKFLREADVTFVNFETPLIKNCLLTDEGMVFCGDKRNVQGLVYSGVDVVNLANNHSSNYNVDGINQTVALLNKNKIEVTGVEKIVYKKIKDTKFAFLGFNDVTSPQIGIQNFDEQIVKKQIKEARNNSDIVIIALHAGAEYQNLPDARQVNLTHFLIDSGADIIVGNHPHWIQGVEIYNNKLIIYALGNTIFDQMWSEETKLGVFGKLTFCQKKLCNVQFFPIKNENFGQPYFLEGKEKIKVLDSMKKSSLELIKSSN